MAAKMAQPSSLNALDDGFSYIAIWVLVAFVLHLKKLIFCLLEHIVEYFLFLIR